MVPETSVAGIDVATKEPSIKTVTTSAWITSRPQS